METYLDDIRANLEYMKKMTGNSKFPAIDKDWQSLDGAIKYIEEKDYREQLREQVIDLWEEIEKKLKMERTPKVRF